MDERLMGPLPNWYVYVLVSEATGRTYVGIALDVAKRLTEHNGEAPGGAKATRGFRPWRVAGVYGPYETRSKVCMVEHQVKKLKGLKRLNFEG